MIDYPVTPGSGRPADPAVPEPTAAPDSAQPGSGVVPETGGTPPAGSPFEPLLSASSRTTAPVAHAPRRGSSRSTTVLLGVAAIVAIGGVAFAIGRMTAPAAAAATGRFGTGTFGAGAFREGAPNASFVPGEGRFGAFGGALPGIGGAASLAIDGTVQSVSGSTMTVKTANGDTVTVDLGPSTTYHTASTSSASSVTSGSQVRVQVQLNRTATGTGTGGVAVPNPSAAPRTLSASDVTVVNP